MNAILSANEDALGLRSTLSTLLHVGLHDLPDFHSFCFTWLEAVLDSNYPDTDKYELSGLILLFLNDKARGMWSGDRNELEFPHYPMVLARFLLLHEDWGIPGVFPTDRSWEFNAFAVLPHPAIIALRLLLGTPKDTFIPPVFMAITPALQENQLCSTRAAGLRLFDCHRHWLFSPVIENIPPTHRAELLEAVGDPFDLSAVPYLIGPGRAQVRDIGDTYLPAKVMGLLLALTSSDTWRDYLHPTNFASCDVVMTRGEHTRDIITFFSGWSSVLKGPGDNNFSGLMLGVNRLKQLRCHSAVKLILLSLWSTPITPLYDQEVWRWVERQTLELFSARGEEHLNTFVPHIKTMYGEAMVSLVAELKHTGGESDPPNVGPPLRVGGVGRHARTKDPQNVGPQDSGASFYTMCQLRRLYRLLGHDPTGAPRGAAPPPLPMETRPAVGTPRSEPGGSPWDVGRAPE